MMPNAKSSTVLAIAGLFLLLTISGCATPGAVILENEEGRVIIESKGDEPYPEGEPYYPSEILRIPKGHMPPPGMCRIWYPDLPPGQQPPPGDCKELKHQVPPGAWLIRGE